MSRSMRRSFPLLAPFLLAVLAGEAHAQRSARAVRTVTPPVIDGRPDDAVWTLATPIGELLQIDPIEGDPTERTEVRILYDADHLYLAARAFDRDPAGIIGTTRERDAFLDADDRFEILFDTFRDRRNAFWFQMNATGSKGDALLSDNGSDFNKPWDGIWEGKAAIDELGWAIELAIPFKTLNFAEGLETWGFNVLRFVGRKNERMRWNNGRRDISFFTVAEAGLLEGIADIRQGIGLDVVPSFVSSWNEDRSGGGDADVLGDPGVDLFYKLSPNLTLSLTVNTDFAETEVDARRINLTRFPLFFPEQRDFFLQDAGNFAFGDQRSRGGGGTLPFFSRRIGLVDGEIVPIVAGGKLTGRVGDYNLGLLDIQTGDTTTEAAGDLDGQNLFVARVSKNVGAQSRIGGIVTNGNPDGTADNTVVGIDGLYRTTSFRGDKNLVATAWALKSDTEGVSGDDASFGAALRYPNDVWQWGGKFEEVQADFDAALGFVPRRDMRTYSADVSFEPRIERDVRNLEFGLATQVVTNTDDVLETWETELQPLGIAWDSGDEFRIELAHTHDELREDFEISDGILVPAGAYDFTRVGVEFDAASKRRINGEAGISVGEFYDGRRTDWWIGLGLRTEPLLTSSLELRQSDVDLDGGEFTTQVAGARANLSFSEELSWNTVVQWDNVSEAIGLNSRLRWIPRPGQEVFLVFNETLDENGDGLSPVFQQVAFKISYTIRL